MKGKKLVVIRSMICIFETKNESDYLKSALVCVKASSESRTLVTCLNNRSNIEYSLDNIEFQWIDIESSWVRIGWHWTTLNVQWITLNRTRTILDSMQCVKLPHVIYVYVPLDTIKPRYPSVGYNLPLVARRITWANAMTSGITTISSFLSSLSRSLSFLFFSLSFLTVM